MFLDRPIHTCVNRPLLPHPLLTFSFYPKHSSPTHSIQGSPEAQFIAKFEIETLLGLMPGSDGGGRMPNPPSYGGMGWGGMPAYGAMPQMYMAPPQMAYGGMMAGYVSQPAVDPYYGYHQQQQQQQQQQQSGGQQQAEASSAGNLFTLRWVHASYL